MSFIVLLSLDVSLLYVECAKSALLRGSGKGPGVPDPAGLGVLPAQQLQLGHATNIRSGAWLYLAFQIHLGMCPQKCMCCILTAPNFLWSENFRVIVVIKDIDKLTKKFEPQKFWSHSHYDYC